MSAPERLDAVIVGGGQSGLALGHYLARRGLRFAILDAGPRVGHTWRARWDSLRLITPCPYNDLPGLPFPAPAWSFPHKDDVADYLERYAERFALPVRLGRRVSAVRPGGAGYRVEAGDEVLEAPSVIIATGAFQRPFIPDLGDGADPALFQIHSADYRRPDQVPDGEVLVVGCGNSGAGIALELAPRRRVHLALGRTVSTPRSLLGRDLFWWAHTLGLTRVTAGSPLGRRLSAGPDGLIGLTPADLERRGVRLAPRLVGLSGRTARFADGSAREVGAVIWASGFRPDFGFVHAPVFDARGAPIHQRGVSAAPGLYFLGLKWQHHIDSSLLGGVGRDAAYLAERITAAPQRATPQRPQAPQRPQRPQRPQPQHRDAHPEP